MSQDTEEAGTSHQKIMPNFDTDPSLRGKSLFGLTLVYSPALLMWAITIQHLNGQAALAGTVSIVVLVAIGTLTVVATSDDESIIDFVKKYVNHYTNQKVLIHEEHKFSESKYDSEKDADEWGF